MCVTRRADTDGVTTSDQCGPTTLTRAYAYALDPTPEQTALLRSHVGGSRFAYNTMLGLVKENWDENRAKKEAGIKVTNDDYIDTGHFGLLYLWGDKRDEMAPWGPENGANTYNDAAQRLAKAITNFHKDRAKFPTFKKRGQGGSVRFTNQSVRVTDSHHVRIARIGEVKTYESTRKLYRHLSRGTGKVLAATLSERSGRWQISFTVEVTRQVPVTREPERVIGVDVGVTTLYTGATPDGTLVLKVDNPHHFMSAEKKLAHAQRIASRRQGPRKGAAPSNRWKKANTRVQKIHTGVRNARRNLIHETTTRLAKNYDVIVLEDLSVAGMVKNHSLAKHIEDAAWAEFGRQLEYKTNWYGSTLVKVDQFYPSSKTCSQCGTVKATLSLDERMYHCGACGLVLGRDHNAAVNLARQGLPGTSSGTGRGGEVSPAQQKLVVTAHPDEASTEPSSEVDGVGDSSVQNSVGCVFTAPHHQQSLPKGQRSSRPPRRHRRSELGNIVGIIEFEFCLELIRLVLNGLRTPSNTKRLA
jgi:putative transposase